jgi:putative transposase
MTMPQVIIEPKHKEILAMDISKERNMFVVEHFISDIVHKYDPQPVSTDGGTWYPPKAYQFLKIEHNLH